MSTLSYFWHDYETFGREPRRDRPAQFAGLRTDAELQEIDAPVMHYCQPAPDFLPEPEACLLTGILPQTCLERGLPEHAFAAAVEAELGRPGTIGVGYNSIRFDDEVTRHLFWRSLIDPYAREWQNQCSRWDLLDVVRCTWALRPEGIVWPKREDGAVSFRLGDLTGANGLAHESAHDALSDVRATLALARLVRKRQPRLFDFCLRLRHKDAVNAEIARARGAGRPFLHVSGMYGVERGCMALVWPLAPHPVNRNELIVWDLAADPAQLDGLDAEALRLRLFTRREALPPGVERLPVKTIHINKSPVVVADLRILGAATAERFGLSLDTALRHAAAAPVHAERVAGLWAEVYRRPPPERTPDVDEDLYGGFVSPADRRALDRLRALPPEDLASKRPGFEDGRLEELLFRYRARNFPEVLEPEDRERWLQHCAQRLHVDAGGGLTLAAYFDRLDTLGEAAAEASDDRAQALLGALYDYGVQIAPPAP